MIHNKTLLWSGDATASITLPEPLSAFERYRVKTNPGVYWESICTADRSVQRFNRYGSWSNDGYMEWPANWVISNGTKQMDCNRFQLLQQNGTSSQTQTFGFNNTAGNVKSILEVWGINRKDGEESGGSGKPEGDGWKEYNETLLWSGTDWASQSHIDLSGRALEYERLKVGVGSFTESTNIYEVDAPTTYTSWLPLRSYWGTSTGSFYLSMHRYQWDNNTSGLNAVSGKTWQLGTGAATPYTTTGNYTATDTFVRRPLFAVWGINKKSPHKLTLVPPTGGTQSASETSGYEYDQITMSNTPDEGWYFSGYNVTGATVNGNIITLQDQDASAQAGFTDEGFPITYQNDGHGTLTGDTNIGIPGQPINLTTSYNTYYRFSGYQVTGGTINGNTLTVTGPCTVKAVFKANAFTATGNFEKGSNIDCYVNGTSKTTVIPAKYALHVAHTGDIPTAWYNTSNRWKVTTAPSAYSITLNTKMHLSGAKRSKSDGYWLTACSLVGSTKTQSQSWSDTGTGWSGNYHYSKSFTSNSTGVNYGVSGCLRASGYGSNWTARAYYYANGTSGTWTATGYAP